LLATAAKTLARNLVPSPLDVLGFLQAAPKLDYPRSVSPILEGNECLIKLHCKSYAVDLIDLVFPMLSPQLVAAIHCTYQDPLQKMQIQTHPGTFAKIARIVLLYGSFITCKLPELRTNLHRTSALPASGLRV